MTVRPGWWAAVLVVVVTNLAPLGIWYWNGRGIPEAALDLSEHELWAERGGDDDRSLRLRLQHRRWRDDGPEDAWADSSRLVTLGFDPRQFTDDEDVVWSPRYPWRRPAWVLLRLEPEPSHQEPRVLGYPSHLVPIAVGDDPEELYRESGDRGNHLVMRGVVTLRPFSRRLDDSTLTWLAEVEQLTPNTLYVPRPLQPVLDELASEDSRYGMPRYLVRVSIGRLHLPRVVAVMPAGSVAR